MVRHQYETSLPKSASVRNEYELLQKLVHEPGSVDQTLRETIASALVSQSDLAAFEHFDTGIVGMSLNTHKAIAHQVIEGGYKTLNEYRRAALQKLREFERRKEGPGRGTINWYKIALAEKNEKLIRVANDIALMSQRLDEVLALAQQMAAKASMLDEFQKQRDELLRKF
jgi:hypothetical protein